MRKLPAKQGKNSPDNNDKFILDLHLLAHSKIYILFSNELIIVHGELP